MENKQASSSKDGKAFLNRRDVWIMEMFKCPDIGQSSKVALARFAFHADNETGEAFVSNATLGKEIGGVSAQTVSRAMSAGIKAGFILERSRGGTSTGKHLTSVRKCVFPAKETLVKTDMGTSDPSQNRHGSMSEPTMTLVKTDMDPSQNRHGPPSELTMTLVKTDYPTNPVTNPLTKPGTNPENYSSELTDVAETVATEGEVRVSLAGESNQPGAGESNQPMAGESNQPSTWKSVNESENYCRNGSDADDGDTVTVVDADAPIFDEAYVYSLTEPPHEDEPEPEWDGEPEPSPAAPTSLPSMDEAMEADMKSRTVVDDGVFDAMEADTEYVAQFAEIRERMKRSQHSFSAVSD